MNKYNQIMEKICVTPEMLSRLQAAARKQSAKSRKMRWRKPVGALAACLVLIIGGTTLMNSNMVFPWEKDLSQPPEVSVGGVQDYFTIEQLTESLSFPLSVPSNLPDGYAFESAANQFGMAVVVYSNGTAQIKYCMGMGEDALVGNNHTDEEYRIAANSAILYGCTDSGYTSAEWQDAAYSYWIISDIPLTEDMWADIITSVEPVDF